MANNYYGDDKSELIINSSFTSNGNKSLDPGDKLSGAGDILSGDINDAIKSTIVGGKDTIGVKDDNGDYYLLENDTIVGDAVNLNASIFTGGADKITLASMGDVADPDNISATVIGDAISANGGSTRGGNDTIIVEGAVTGTIIGDVEEVTNTTFTAGNDNIQLKGKVTNAEIYTDAKNYNGANTLLGGNDIVTLGLKGKDTILVTNSTINLGHGNDNFTAHSTLGEGTRIEGMDGNDRFTIANMTAGNIDGGDGNDTISATTMTGNIDGGAGNDIFTVTYFTGSLGSESLWGGSGNDKITITEATNVDINGNDGNDTIFIAISSTNSNINGGSGNDSITVKAFTGSLGNNNLYGDDGNDKINVDTATNANIGGDTGNDTITVANLNGGSIEGLGDNDSINVTTATNANISGDIGNDTITVTHLKGGFIWGRGDNDSIKVTNTSNNASIEGGTGIDIITVTNLIDSTVSGNEDADNINISKKATNSTVYGNDGDDSIKITTATGSSVDGGTGTDSIAITNLSGDGLNGQVDGGTDDDSITITTMTDAKITDAGGNDSVKIVTLKGEHNSINLGDGADTLTINNFTANKANVASENALNMGAGDDSLNILAKKTNYTDTDFADALGTGNDTLNVNWAFNGEFNSPDADGDTLITKGLGADAVLNFGAGDDNLTITGAASGNKSVLTDTDTKLVESLGAGQDTLNVGWAFNGAFNTSDGDGKTLITKGLNASSTLQFGAGNDGLQVIGALANRQINTLGGADTVSVSSTATNVQVDLGAGSDAFSVGSMGKGSTLTYDTDGADNITIKGAYNAGFVTSTTIIDGEGGEDTTITFDGLSTGDDGGSITLDTLGSGKLQFGDGADNLTINKNIAGTATVKKEISTLAGNDSIDLKGTVTNTIVDAGDGVDIVSIGALSTGSTLKYNADGADSITIKGTYNAGFAQTTVGANTFYGLATGDDGGSITLDTLGTGKLQFDDGADTLTINKALSGSLGLKDIFMQSGDDSVILNTVNGAVISGGDDNDDISATGLGATGVLNGDGGEDTIQIGREFTDADSFKATATMKSGIIDGGDDNDTIYIGNTLDTDADGIIEAIKGTLSGGKVYGGLGNDTITTTTLSGSALMDGGADNDTFTITNISGGTIEGGLGNDTVNIAGTFSRGTINAGDGNDTININSFTTSTMTGGTINGGAGQDKINVENFKGGVINTNDDTEVDTFEIETMTGGTINSGAGDVIDIQNMNGGVINDSADDSGNIVVEETMTKGTINGNDGDDTIGVSTMNGGIVNGQDGDDYLVLGHLNGGTVNAGEGDNFISIYTALNGGNILAGKGNDTLILSDGVTLSGKYSINLGAGDNEIQVQSDLSGQALTLGATHDNVVLQKDVSLAKINLGTGNDTINGYINDTSTTDVVIDASTGNDFMSFNVLNDGSFIYGGAGNDIIEAVAVNNAVIDAGTGNNSITIGGGSIANNVDASVITGNTGHDNILVHGKLINDSFISASTGNDSINADLWDDVNSAVSGKIHYDNKGQDSIILKTYAEGMVADVKGDVTAIDDDPDTTSVDETVYHALSTGTDGGSIQIDAWASGAITFGNGNDKFVFDFYGDGTNTLHGSLFFGSGTDTIDINGDFDGHAISYDNQGQDYIRLNSYIEGMVADVAGNTTDDEGKAYALSTGTDGGKIELYAWVNSGTDENPIYGEITFGNGNDHFILHTGATVRALDFFKGQDTIDVASLNSTITYNNDKFDTIIIESEYTGTGIQTINGTDTINGISTGAGGGYVSVASIKTEAGANALEFSNSVDYFNIGVLNIVDDEGKPVADAPTIELLAGNDILQVGILTNGSIDVGTGLDAITVNQLAGGSIIYDTDGLDNIVIKGVYAGTGIKYYGEDANGDDTLVEGISTGADGGTIIIAEINDEDGVNTLEFSDKADRFEIAVLDVDGLNTASQPIGDDTISLKSGNDSIAIGDIAAGTIDAGLGNDGVFGISQSGDWYKGATFTGGALVGDATTITTDTSFTAGADRFLLDSLSGTAKIYGDAQSVTATNKLTIKGGNDTITILGNVAGDGIDTVANTVNYVTIVGDMERVDNAKTFTAGNDSITFYGNVEYAEIYTDTVFDPSNVTTVNGGNDTLTLRLDTQGWPTTFSNTLIDLGHGSNILTAYASLNSTSIESGTGVDKINLDTFENGSSLKSGGGNDVITVNLVGESSIDTAAGNDKITIENLSGTDTVDHFINAGAGNDTLNITSISGDVVINAGDGNDHMTIDDITGGTLNGGSDIGNDTFIITTMTGGTANGGAGNDSFNLSTVSGGIVNAGDGNDIFIVKSFESGTLSGDDGNDKFNITTMTGGTIEGGTANLKGTDSITVKNASNAEIYGDDTAAFDDAYSYNDIIKITGTSTDTDIYGGYGIDNITVTTMTGGTVNGQDNNDIIKVTTMNGGSVDGGNNDDTITITTARGGSVLGGAGDGNDKITVTTGMGDEVNGGFSLDGGAGNDTIAMTTLNRGSIEGGIGVDTITVKNAYASSIYGDENGGSDTTAYNDIIKITGLAENTDIFGGYGNDAITVGTATAGSVIDGGAGDDNIKVTTLTDSSISGGAGNDDVYVTSQIKTAVGFDNAGGSDEIFLTGGIGAGAEVTLSGSGDFNIAKSYNAKNGYTGFNMSGGTLNGSAGVDNIHLTTFSGGHINTGTGADNISVANAINKTVSFENGADADGATIDTDNLYLTKGIVAGANITLSGDGGFNVAKNDAGDGIAMTGGTLTGSAGADSFNVLLSGVSKGLLVGGAGADVFNIGTSTTKASSITIDDFEIGTDILKINGQEITVEVGESFAKNGDVTVYFNTVYVPSSGELQFENLSNQTIYGTGGKDTITISGTATNSTINALVSDDSITVGTINASTINTGAGADTTTINKVITKAATITNEDGADELYFKAGIGAGGKVSLEGAGGFVVAAGYDTTNNAYAKFNLASGTLTGSDGADTFHIDKMSSGTLSGGDGADKFNIATLSGGTVNGDAGADTFTVTTMSGGIINGGADADSINITTMNGGTIDGGTGADITTITNSVSKTIRINNTGIESDAVFIEGGINGGNVILTSNVGFELTKDGDSGFTMAAGTITGSVGDDNFLVAEMKGGTINGGAGDDKVIVETMSGGTLNAGAGDDSIIFTSIGAIGGTINGGAGTDTLRIDTINATLEIADLNSMVDNIELFAFNNLVTNGVINGTENDDTIEVHAITGGSIFTHDGDDVIILGSVPTGGSIDGGAGNNTVLFREVNETIEFGAITSISTNVDTFAFNKIVTNGVLNGTADRDIIEVYTMSGGELNAGAGANIIAIDQFNGGTVNAGDDMNNITIHHANGGTINAGGDNDAIFIYSATGGSLDTGTGADTITFDSFTAADYSINNSGADSADTIFFNNALNSGTLNLSGQRGFYLAESYDSETSTHIGFDMSGGTLNGSEEEDRFYIKTLSGGIINGGDNLDVVTVDTLQDGFFDGGAHEGDMLVITTVDTKLDLDALTDNVEFFSATNLEKTGQLLGTNAGEYFSIYTMNGGNITAGSGDDNIYITTLNEFGSIDGGEGTDILTIENSITTTLELSDINNVEYITLNDLSANGIINGSAGADTFTVKTMHAGTINGGDGDDAITVESMLAGIIHGGDGDDTITVTINGETSNAELWGGAGADTFNISSSDGAEIKMYDFEAGDTVIVNNTDITANLLSSLNAGNPSFLYNGDILIDLMEQFGASTMTEDITTNDVRSKIYIIESTAGFNITASSASDSIYITTLTADSEVKSMAGSDNIVITNMSGGTVSLGADDDSVLLYTLPTGGSIDGGTGKDSLFMDGTITSSVDLDALTDNVENFEIIGLGNGGQILGTASDDLFHLYNLPTGGLIDGRGGIDTFSFAKTVTSTMDLDALTDNVEIFEITGLGNGGSILGTTDDDHIRLNILPTFGKIDGREGTDTLTINLDITSIVSLDALTDNVENFVFAGLQNGGKISGTDEDDHITLKTVPTGGFVDGYYGTDTLAIDAVITTTVDLETLTDHVENFVFTGLESNGQIFGTSSADYITLKNIPTGGTIDGRGGIDTLFIDTVVANRADLTAVETQNMEYIAFKSLVEGGEIVGAAGDERFILDSMTGGSISGFSRIYLKSLPLGGNIERVDGKNNSLKIDTAIDETVDLAALESIAPDYHIEFDALVEGGSIIGSDADDFFDAYDMTGGSINTGGGDDWIRIYNYPTGGTIDGGDGYDELDIIWTDINTTVKLNELANNVEEFGFGDMLDGGEILGTDNNDVITITNMSGGSIAAGAGDDTILLYNAVTGGTIDGGEGTNTLHLTYDINGRVEIAALPVQNVDKFIIDDLVTRGVIVGTVGDDHITLKNIPTGGLVAGGGGTDTLAIDAYINTSVDLETLTESVENFIFNVITSTGEILGTNEADNITVSYMKSGTINAGAGNDSIIIYSLPSDGHINGGNGIDTLVIDAYINSRIELGSLTAGVEKFGFDGLIDDGEIIGTANDDYIILNNLPSGGIIDGGDGTDTLFIDTSINSSIDFSALADNVEYFEFANLEEGAEIIGNFDGSTRLIVHSMTGGSITGFNDVTLKSIPLGGSIEGVSGLWSTVTIDKDIDGIVDLDSLNSIVTDFNVLEFTNIVQGGSIVGSDDNDIIRIYDMSGGSINLGLGNDRISMYSLPTGGSIDGGEGYDEFSLYNTDIATSIRLADIALNVEEFYFDDIVSGGEIIGTADNNVVKIGDMAGGKISAEAGNDSIHLYRAPTGGTIDGGDGTDTVSFGYDINSSVNLDTLTDNVEVFEVEDNMVSGGEIIGTAGNETINIDTMEGGTIDAGAGNDSISVRINATTSSANLSGGAGADTFNITGDGNINITDFNAADGDSLFVDGTDRTNDVSGEASQTWDGITIYFG